jgi:hypothetical protein
MYTERAQTNKLAILAAAAMLVGAALVVVAPPISASASIRGGLDLNAYCAKTYGSGYSAVLLWNTASGWHCRKGSGASTTYKGVYFSNACSQRYGVWRFGYDGGSNNPYGVFCYD